MRSMLGVLVLCLTSSCFLKMEDVKAELQPFIDKNAEGIAALQEMQKNNTKDIEEQVASLREKLTGMIKQIEDLHFKIEESIKGQDKKISDFQKSRLEILEQQIPQRYEELKALEKELESLSQSLSE